MGSERDVEAIAEEFIRLDTEAAVYQTLVSVASEHLPAALCKVAVVDGDNLVPHARSDDKPVDPDRLLALEGTSIGHTVTTGTSKIIDDIQFKRSAASGATDQELDPGLPRAVLAVPMGDDAVLVGTSTKPGAFAPQDRDTAERFVSYAEAALDRINRDSVSFEERDRFDEFSSLIAHDLRSPLGVARGYLAHAQETGDFDDLDAAVEALDRMDQMITDLREFVESSYQTDVEGGVSLSDLAAECWTTIETGQATLSIVEDIEICADQSQLRQLLENLFRNAIDYGGEDVTVSVGQLADGFYVEDTGPGIPPELGDDIFQVGVTTHEAGTGYGLAIVKRIVDAHGWEITVMESAEGGARFEITGVK